MFTGIIESVGTVTGIKPYSSGFVIEVDSGLDLSGDAVGDSIAVDGICLTATKIAQSKFTATASRETVTRSTLGSLKTGSKVNIERALTLSTRLGGHIVLGHVDCVARIREKRISGESIRFSIELDKSYSKYVIEKGSIAVDGISLTINSISSDAFELNIIPFTLESTSLTLKTSGDRVNLEFDVIGKYVQRMIENKGGATLGDLLKQNGFI
ncbi:MAG TPA: riboflavin synthase [Desulfomonilia bacterium]|jgi:riboflavin synthase